MKTLLASALGGMDVIEIVRVMVSVPVIVIPLIGSSCAGPPVPPPPSSYVAVPAAPAALQESRKESAPQAPVEAELTLERALDLAFAHHPRLALARAQVGAAAARARQAGLRPNPALVAGFESAPLDGGSFSNAEVLFGLSLGVPLSGRLARQRDVAQHERRAAAELAQAELANARRDVHGAFATALHAQEVASLFEELSTLSGEAASMMQARLEAGDAIEGDTARLRMQHGLARREAQKARAAWQAAAKALAATLGQPALPIRSLQGELDTTLALPELSALMQELEDNPTLLSAAASSDAARSRVAQAKAARIPTLRFDLLYRRDGALDQDGFDAVMSLPLPLFNTGRGRVAETRHALQAALARERATRNQLDAGLRAAHAAAQSALQELHLLRTEVLPPATELLELARARYSLGDTPLDDLLQARRALTILRLEERAAQRDVLQAWADLAPFLPPDS